ncbi:hypothetical protein [Roseomonas sp. BN140053]|uniref:hypothetical protein n=1 Tax=Roseomonas sp. BN140053 TaxID=3391898 RepID=UPI0039EC8E29
MPAPVLPFLLLLTGGLAAASSPATVATAPAENGWRVRPDSIEYCRELADRLSVLPGGGQEPARSLGAEGARLCQAGHVRTGVAKLRRAIREAQGS